MSKSFRSRIYTGFYTAIKTAVLTGLILNFTVACSTGQKKDAPRRLTKKEKFESMIDIASNALSEGDATSALISLNRAEEIESDSEILHYLYALSYYTKGEHDLAAASARKSIQSNPKFSAAKNTLGKVLMDQGKTAEAEKYLYEASRDLLNPDAYLASTNLGVLYYKKSKTDQALAEFERAIKANPDMACVAIFYRGKIELDRDQLLKAQNDFQRSSKGMCSGLTDAHLSLAKTFVRNKKYDQARSKFFEIQQLFPMSQSAQEADDLLRTLPTAPESP
jgi:Tfp pilus assembly protein PilF